MWQGARSNLALAIAQWDGLENDVSKAAYCYINYAFLYQATFNTRGNHNGTKLILLFKFFSQVSDTFVYSSSIQLEICSFLLSH